MPRIYKKMSHAATMYGRGDISANSFQKLIDKYLEELEEDINMTTKDDGVKRTFETGATRDTSYDKYDPEGFLSVLVVDRYCEYMHKNRVQSDGSLRDSDNWQKGMGFSVFMKSTWRHFLDMWKIHRGYRAFRKEKGEVVEVDMEDALCGLLFNVMGYLHEILIKKLTPTKMTLKCEENNSDQKTS